MYSLLSILAITSGIQITSASLATSNPSMLNALEARASFAIPVSQGSVTYKAAQNISSVFDGGMKTYGRGVSCTGQDEGGDADTVFLVQPGGTLKNLIIGQDQIEGIHCLGSCTIENVWWSTVCEGR